MAARYDGLDTDEWNALMKEVLHLPPSMLPAVQHAVKQGAWRRANDPIRCVTEAAEREIARMRLSEKAPAQIAKEKESLGRYPDLRKESSELFREAALRYGLLVKAGVSKETAMEKAAEETAAEFAREGKKMAPPALKGK